MDCNQFILCQSSSDGFLFITHGSEAGGVLGIGSLVMVLRLLCLEESLMFPKCRISLDLNPTYFFSPFYI